MDDDESQDFTNNNKPQRSNLELKHAIKNVLEEEPGRETINILFFNGVESYPDLFDLNHEQFYAFGHFDSDRTCPPIGLINCLLRSKSMAANTT